jgi:hypothetical protein
LKRDGGYTPLRFIKMLLGLKGSTSTVAVYVETGRFPLHLKFKVSLVKYFIRLQNMDGNKIVKIVFNMLKELTNFGFKVWTSNVKEILEEYNMDNFYNLNMFTVEQETMCIRMLKERVYERYIAICMKMSSKATGLRSYVKFKYDYGFEQYLLKIRDFKPRKIMSKFRLSSHNLQIEKGRHSYPKVLVDRRLCLKCNSGQIEDEFHVLVQCQFYENERCILFSQLNKNKCNIMSIASDEDKFICFLCVCVFVQVF